MPLHLFIVHFPVALIVTAAVLDLIGVALQDRSIRLWAGGFLIVGGFLAFLSFATGEGAKLAVLSSGEIDLMRLELHQQWGAVGAWGLLIAALLRGLWRNRTVGLFGWLNLLIVLAATALVIGITLSGTMVRHG